MLIPRIYIPKYTDFISRFYLKILFKHIGWLYAY